MNYGAPLNQRVVITGIGVVNSAGVGKDDFWSNISSGKSGIRKITRFDAEEFPTQVAGEIADFAPEDFIPPRFVIKTDRFTHYALAAAELALQDAALDLAQEDSYRVGVWFGNNAGGWDIAERGFYELYNDGPTMVNPWQATAWFPTAAQGFTTIRYGIRGYSKSFVCDRASGASGLYFGAKSILQGHNDVVLAGGSEAPITRFGMTCYYETGELSANPDPDRAYQPFDLNRSGLVLGEGSTVLILESAEHAMKRGAKIYGEVLAGHTTTDLKISSGKAFERAMQKSLQEAGIAPEQVDLLLAEGCGTQVSDRVEAQAIATVFGDAVDSLPVSVPKALYGHLYGASCATEVACGLLAMESETLPMMQPLDNVDPECQLNFVTQPTQRSVDYFMVNSRAREAVNFSFVVGRNQPLN
jgi:3-oxoacyl-[acyl-carrier-protein] synthase II